MSEPVDEELVKELLMIAYNYAKPPRLETEQDWEEVSREGLVGEQVKKAANFLAARYDALVGDTSDQERAISEEVELVPVRDIRTKVSEFLERFSPVVDQSRFSSATSANSGIDREVLGKYLDQLEEVQDSLSGLYSRVAERLRKLRAGETEASIYQQFYSGFIEEAAPQLRELHEELSNTTRLHDKIKECWEDYKYKVVSEVSYEEFREKCVARLFDKAEALSREVFTVDEIRRRLSYLTDLAGLKEMYIPVLATLRERLQELTRYRTKLLTVSHCWETLSNIDETLENAEPAFDFDDRISHRMKEEISAIDKRYGEKLLKKMIKLDDEVRDLKEVNEVYHELIGELSGEDKKNASVKG